MGERQRVSVPSSATRSAATPAAREAQSVSRARTDRHEADAPALRHMLATGALQPRLTVGPADDPYEREAERTADLVMSPDMTSKMSGPAIPRTGLAASLSRVVRRAMGKANRWTEDNVQNQPKGAVAGVSRFAKQWEDFR